MPDPGAMGQLMREHPQVLLASGGQEHPITPCHRSITARVQDDTPRHPAVPPHVARYRRTRDHRAEKRYPPHVLRSAPTSTLLLSRSSRSFHPGSTREKLADRRQRGDVIAGDLIEAISPARCA